jgi:hypothetical protein
MAAVLEAAESTCRLKADEKQVRLEIQCNAELTAPINAAFLEQAVVNLMDNAVVQPAGSIMWTGLAAASWAALAWGCRSSSTLRKPTAAAPMSKAQSAKEASS